AWRNALAQARNSLVVERPDLHGPNARTEQLSRELAGLGKRALVVRVPGVPGTGIVSGDALAAGAAQERVNRLSGQFAEQVPQRDVDRAQCAHLRAGVPGVMDDLEHVVPE